MQQPIVIVGICTVELPGIVQEREQQVEEVLTVGVTTDPAPDEVWHAFEQPIAEHIESLDGAIVGEQPAAHAERVGVLHPEVPHRGVPYVDQGALGTHAVHDLVPVERVSLEERTLLV